VNGIPAGQVVNAVREDPNERSPVRRTEKGVYVSFNDGANWNRCD